MNKHFLINTLFLSFLFTHLAAGEIKVFNDSAKPVKITSISSFNFNNTVYIDALSFAEALSLKASLSSREQTVTFTLPDYRIKLTGDNHFITCGGKPYNLLNPIKLKEGNLYLPAGEFIEKLGFAFPGKLLFYRQELLHLPRQCNIAKIYSSRQGDLLYLDILTTEKVGSSCIIEQDRVIVKIPGGKISAEVWKSSALPAGFSAPETVFSGDTLIINLKIPPSAVFASVVDLADAYGIRLTAKSAGLADDKLKQNLARVRSNWKFDTIVIDPGHGGKDPGAIGPKGILEKNITLDLALKLEKILKNKTGLKVVLTRNKDVFIPLHERGKIANRAGGKLFISLHCNANKDRRVNGFEIYFLSPARSDQAMKAALLENAVVKYEDDPDKYKDLTDENYILLAMTQSNDVRLSEEFGAALAESLDNKTTIKNRGLDQAGFYVLYGASMPAVLVETAFISNKAEEEKLRSKNFRQTYTEALAESIIKFCQSKE